MPLLPVQAGSTGQQLTLAVDRSWLPALAAAGTFFVVRKRQAGTLTAALAAYGAWELAKRIAAAAPTGA